jgi:GMP synthase-like glutamine amidotransferase
LAGRGVPFQRTDVLAPDDLEDGVAGVLLVDGGGSALDAGDRASALTEGLRAAVTADLPALGVGPGAQSLAVALGGDVAPRATPEAAYVPLHRTAPGQEHPVTAGWPDGAAALVLHRDEVVRLPTGADQLLLGSDGPSAWALGSALGIAMRVDVDLDQIRAWLALGGAGYDLVADAGRSPEDLLAEAERRRRYTRAVGMTLLLRWVDELDL